jgi:hypothetical protein
LSPAAVSSDWVSLERNTVLFRDPSNKQRRFIPLLLSDCDLPDALRRYRYIDFRTRSLTAFGQLLAAVRENSVGPESARARTSTEMREEVAGLVRSRKNEWKRLRADFEDAARAYHDIEMKVFFTTNEKPSSTEQFREPNHVISLWQFFGVYPGADTRERIRHMKLTKFGITDAELNAFGIITGEQTNLFCKMASRAGSLLPDDINITLIRELSKRIEDKAKPGKPIFVTNGNALAKWLNLVLIITSTWHPDRFKEFLLQVDPFTASLAVFDFFPLDEI